MKNRKLLFICGFPSGGTDLFKNILNSHPEVYINGEMQLLKNITKYGYNNNFRFSNIDEIKRFKKILKNIDIYNNLENIRFDFSESLNNDNLLSLEFVLHKIFSDKNKKVWGNKTPQNTENISHLNDLFPDAYYLIIIRDIRDICLSWRKKWGKDMYLCAYKWDARMKKLNIDLKKIQKDKYLIIRYEDLLLNTDLVTKKITDFLGINWDKKMLDHHKYIEGKKDGKINYGKSLVRDNFEKWRDELNSKELRKIEEISFQNLKSFGYRIQITKRQKKLFLLTKIILYLKDLFSIVFIGNRRSSKNTFKNRMRNFILEIKKLKNK